MEDQRKLEVVKNLQKKLEGVELEFVPLTQRKLTHGIEWDDVRNRAKEIRQQLYDLTGDWYGKPKAKIEKPNEELLTAKYDSPEDIPAEVLSWVRKNAAILTSDATDAVRWGRIVDTVREDRLQGGEITVYRAIELGSEIVDEIRPGDWITPDLSYAEDHLRRWLGGKGRVLEMTVDGSDVLISPTGNYEEAIYAPVELSGPVRSSVRKKRNSYP